MDPDGPQLWLQVAGQGDPTVVFEADSAEDSSVWAEIEPQIRLPSGVRTVLYDRAGLGRSEPAVGPYRIDDEAVALGRALSRIGVKGPIVLVAHGYGGFVATLLATTDKRVVGVVLVDAHVPGLFGDAELARVQARHAQSLAALQRTNVRLAEVTSPVMRAFPETVRRLRAVAFPPSLPVIDIVAERSDGSSEVESAAMRRAHEAFVAASPERELVVAPASGHHVMRDRPDLLIAEIARMVRLSRER